MISTYNNGLVVYDGIESKKFCLHRRKKRVFMNWLSNEKNMIESCAKFPIFGEYLTTQFYSYSSGVLEHLSILHFLQVLC